MNKMNQLGRKKRIMNPNFRNDFGKYINEQHIQCYQKHKPTFMMNWSNGLLEDKSRMLIV